MAKKNILEKIKGLAPLFLIFLCVVFLYAFIFKAYLIGDDFFHIKVSLTDGTWQGFLNLFGFHPFAERLIAFYRPVTRELIYFLFYQLFGLSHVPFRVLSLLIHLINIMLTYFLILKFFSDRKLAFFVSFFFGIAAANVTSLSFSAAGLQTTGAALFVLLTLILFNKYPKLSFLTFLLGLASHELAMAVLPLLVLKQYFKVRTYQPKNYLLLIPHLVVVLIYLYLNITVIGFSQGEIQYQPVFNPKMILNTLSWYSLWAWGMPEMLVDYVRSGLTLNPNLMSYWGNYFRIIFPSFLISAMILVGGMIWLLFKKRNFFQKKELWFFGLWFILGLLPMILLPSHRSSYYLAVSLPAFWTVIGLVAREIAKTSKILLALLTLSLLVLTFTSIEVNKKTYWATQRGLIAGRLIEKIKNQYPQLPKGATVFWLNDPEYPHLSGDWQGSSNQAYFVLNGSDALQLLYQDSTLKVYYEDRDALEKTDTSKTFKIVAEIN